jgi:hypothetical protein
MHERMKVSFLTVIACCVLGAARVATADDQTKSAKLADLVKVTGLGDSIEKQKEECKHQAEALRPQIMQQLLETFPDTDKKFWSRFDAAYARFVDSSKPSWTTEEAVAMYARLYGEHVTEDELDQILTFYRSPIGQKDIVASHEAGPKWRTLLMEKNQEVFQKNYQVFLADLRKIVEESAPEPGPPKKNDPSPTKSSREPGDT